MASCLFEKAPVVFPVFPKAYAVDYTVGAVGYHCKRLAEVYAEISRHFASVSLFQENTTGLATFEYVPEPYYEFDALITAARRAYEFTRYLLWYSFGPRKSSTPSSFRRTLDRCTHIPPTLAERLEKSWTLFGKKLAAYRDCIQHNVTLDQRCSTAFLEQIPQGAWKMAIWIPDNPEDKSGANFAYANRLDALTYGWNVTTELLEMAVLILGAVPHETIGVSEAR